MNKNNKIKNKDILRHNLSREEYAKELSPFSIKGQDLNRADYFDGELSEDLIEIGKDISIKRPELIKAKRTDS